MKSKHKNDFHKESYEIFNYEIGHLFPKGRVLPGINISNPLLTHNQETPSFNVFRASDGNFIFNDFATGDKGNCITFIQKLKNMNYSEAISYINKIHLSK